MNGKQLALDIKGKPEVLCRVRNFDQLLAFVDSLIAPKLPTIPADESLEARRKGLHGAHEAQARARRIS